MNAIEMIARGIAASAYKAAQQALNEFAKVVEGTMNEAHTEFTDVDGNVVVPDDTKLYFDNVACVYYRWNGSAYFQTSFNDVVRYGEQSLTTEQKEQARANIGSAPECDESEEGEYIAKCVIDSEGNKTYTWVKQPAGYDSFNVVEPE